MLTIADMLSLLEKQNGKCVLSGVDMTFTAGQGNVPTNASIDRIDSSAGYVIDNVQLTCVAVNKMKRDYPQEDFLEWCRLVAKTHPPTAPSARRENVHVCPDGV